MKQSAGVPFRSDATFASQKERSGLWLNSWNLKKMNIFFFP